MSNIDTSAMALRDIAACCDLFGRKSTADLLLALAAEKEAQERQEPVAHMYPSDLERFKNEETTADAFSIAVGCPTEESVPLWTSPQAHGLRPLSNHYVGSIAGAADLKFNWQDDYLEAVEFIIRQTEKHHGITQQLDISGVSNAQAECAAIKTLQSLGYTYHGGIVWKPPLGEAHKPVLSADDIEDIWAGASDSENPEMSIYEFARLLEARITGAQGEGGGNG